MRLTGIVFALFLCAPAFTSGQGWIEFSSRDDRFAVNFPGQPRVEATSFVTEGKITLPARIYSATSGQSKYSLLAVDYSNTEQLHAERAKNCPPGAHTGCTGSATMGVGGWIIDIRGAMDFAVKGFLQRDAKVTFYGWNFIDLVEGKQLQITNNADASRTYVAIYMHENRLYVLEATVPKGYPEPGLFQQSLQFLDADGKTVRYESVYTNFSAPPKRTR